MGRQFRAKSGLWMTAVILALLSACGPEPTPFPVDLPQQATPTPQTEPLAALQYVLMPNTANAIPDLELISSGVEVIQLTGENPPIPEYDLIVAYGVMRDWRVSELTPTLSLVLNTDAEIASIVQRSLDMQSLVTELNIPGMTSAILAVDAPATLRIELANLGYPDGIQLGVGYTPAPAIDRIVDQWQAANINAQITRLTENELTAALETERIQVALILSALDTERAAWIEQFGADSVIDLYTVPISYQVREGLQLSFTPSGFPLIRR